MKKVFIVVLLLFIISLVACSVKTDADVTDHEPQSDTEIITETYVEKTEADVTEPAETVITEAFFSGVSRSTYGKGYVMSRRIIDLQEILDSAARTNENDPEANCEAALCLVRAVDVDAETVKLIGGEWYTPIYTFEILKVYTGYPDAASFKCLKEGATVKTTDASVFVKEGVLYNPLKGNLPITEKNAMYLLILSYQDRIPDYLEESKENICPYNVMLHQVYTLPIVKQTISEKELDNMFAELSKNDSKSERYDKYIEYIKKYAKGFVAEDTEG